MAGDSTVKVTFIGENRDLKKAINDSDRELSGFTQKVGNYGRNIAIGMAAAGVGVAVLAKGTVDAASNQNEALNKSNVVFGDNAKAVETWSKSTAKSLGLSKTDALSAAGGFGNLFDQLDIGSEVSAEMSTSLVGLAADFASFHNADITDVLEAQSAAFRGEYDALQRYVPTISAATVEQKALQMTGKATTKELTAQDKALAVNALMFEGAGEAVGDFARTSDGAANQQRIMQARLEDLQATIGQKLLPVYTALLGFILDKVIPGIESVVKWMQEHKGITIALAAVIGTVFVAALVAWAVAAASAAAATIAAAAPVIAITAAIAALAAGVIYAYTHWGWFRTAVDAVASFMRDTLWPIIQTVAGFISDHFVPIIQTIVDIFTLGLIPAATAVYNFFNDHVLPVLKDIAGFINDDVIPAVKAVKEKFEEFGTKVGEIWDGLKETVEKAVTFILEQIDKLTQPLENILDKVGDLAGKIGITGKGSIDWDKVKGSRAGGGPITSGSWLVGERGPEVVTVGGNGFVTPNGMGGGASFNFYGPVYGMDDFERKVADAAEKFAQRNGMN